ncbi:MAG: hypothetical protein ACI9MC_004298 [Kiritimatiellia bacterium]|jgi:hypothetical protein
MRLLLPLLLCLPACKSDETDTDTDVGTDTEFVCHPNVPEEYCFLWNSDGCKNDRGGPANQGYYTFEGESDADGNFEGVETIYWFFPQEGWDEDCVDKMKVTGTRLLTDPALLGCVGCEELYTVRREMVQQECAIGYNMLYQEDDDGYFSTLLFDTLNASGDPNEDDKMQVLHRKVNNQNQSLSTKDYARGHIQPLGDTHAPPAKYDWVGSKCGGW